MLAEPDYTCLLGLFCYEVSLTPVSAQTSLIINLFFYICSGKKLKVAR
jgi:hypothetical protein